jgi:hypothetical protein
MRGQPGHGSQESRFSRSTWTRNKDHPSRLHLESEWTKKRPRFRRGSHRDILQRESCHTRWSIAYSSSYGQSFDKRHSDDEKSADDKDSKTSAAGETKDKEQKPGETKETKPGEEPKSGADKKTKPGGNLSEEFTDKMKTLAGENPEQLDAILKQSFNNATPSQIETMKKDAANGNLSIPENVSFVEPSQLHGAQAAYDADNGGSVMLSESLKSDPEALSKAYTEEMGHHLDSHYTKGDSTGDEGQIFQEGADGGKALSDDRVQELRSQNDKGVATVDGRQKQVENRREELPAGAQNEQPSLARRYEGAEDQYAEASQKLDQANESLDHHQDWFNDQKEAAHRYQATGQHRVHLPKAENSYNELLRRENRTEAETKQMSELGSYADRFYGSGGNSFTSLANKEYKLEQARDQAKAEVGKAQDSKKALQDELVGLPQDEKAKVQAEYKERISSGQRVGAPENLSSQQQEHLQTLNNPDATAQDKRMAMSRLKLDMVSGRNTDTATEPGVADELAKRMQAGDRSAYEALKGAAELKNDGTPRNPRAHQLMQNLELSKGEQTSLDQQISELRNTDGYMDRNALRDQFRNRGAAADYMTDKMTDYIANHTSDEQADKSRDYPTDFQNPGAQEQFLAEMSKKNPDIADKVEIAKLGQARMDLMETKGGDQVREAAHQKLSSALNDPEKAPAVREFYASYEGELSSAANFLEGKKDYDSLALLSQAKETSNTSLGMDYYLGKGGRDAAEGVQRQYQHLNEQGRETAGEFFESTNRDQLTSWTGEGGIDGLPQSVADSIKYTKPNEYNGKEYTPASKRMEALKEGKTDQTREALASLSGDERKLGTHEASDTIGESALESLEADPSGRDRYFEALRSDQDGARRNALRAGPTIGFTTDYSKEKEYTTAQREEFLSSTVEALGKTNDPELRKKAVENIGEVGIEDPRHGFGSHDPASFESRAEAYGALHAQADDLDPNSADYKEIRGLADGVGNADVSGTQEQLNTRNEIQERLNDSALGDDNESLAQLAGASDARSLTLADSRLRHAGDEDGLVGRIDEMRQNDPAGYQQLLHESSKDRGFQQPGELSDFLDKKAEVAPAQKSNSELPKEQQAAISQRLGRDLAGALQNAPESTAGQLAQDVKRTQEFTSQVKELETQREQMKKAGQDTSAVDRKIEEATQDYESRRFDSQGLQGRMDAAESLGDQYGKLEEIAQAQGLQGRDFDNLLMKSAELQRLGNQQGLDTLLELGGRQGGLNSSDMNLMMDMAQDMPPDQFDANLAPGSSASEVRERFADTIQQEVNDYASGVTGDGWFGEQGRLDTKGERATDFLVDNGRASELLYNSDGQGSAFDRMSQSNDPAAQRTASRIADRIVDSSRTGTPLNNAGRMAQEKLDGAPKGERPDSTIGRLENLHANTDRLSGDDRELQQRVNADVRYQQTKTILGRKTGQGANEAEQAVRAHRDLLTKIEADQNGFPQGDKFENENEKLEAARILTEGRLDAAKQGERSYELERQKELMLGDNANHRQIEAMMGMFINSPTDELSLKVDAKVGVELQAALFGNAEAYVKGSLGMSATEKEDGKFALNFSSAFGVGAGAQLGPGDKTLAKAAVEGEAFANKSVEFNSKEEAARFLAQKLWDAQDKLGMKPKGDRPEVTAPSDSVTTGTKYKETLQLGAVSFERQRENATKVKEQSKPWLAAEDDKKRHTEIHTTKDSMSAELDLGSKSFGISMEAEDQVGDKNNVGNGTTLQLAMELGIPLGSSQAKIVDSTVEKLMASTGKLDPSGAWKSGLSDEQVREKLTKQFGTGQLKLNAKGALELNFASDENLMLNSDGTPKLNENGEPVNGADVFQSWMKDTLSGDTDALWQLNNARVASELEMNFSQRVRYGTGIVNAFAEVGITAKYRDATTLAGSMLHGRFMLYGHTQGKSMDRDQIAELQKDGIINASGRDRGRVNNDALNYSLGRMRNEFDALYQNEEWRNQNLRMADGSMMSQEQFQQNIDEYLVSARDAVYGGVEKTGKAQNRDAFKEAVNIDSIKKAQEFLQSKGLMDDEEVHSYGQYLDYLGSLETQPGIPTQLLNNARQEVDRRLQTRLDALLGNRSPALVN